MPTTTPISTITAADEPPQLTPSPLNLVSALQTEKQTLTEIKYSLSHALQSSLDLNETLSHFFELMQKFLVIDGMIYENTDKSANVKLGEQRAHQANYALSASESPLGKISFSRAKRFQESDLQTIETLIGILVLPLRNALLYREALASSLRDPLTSVGNRRAMDECLKHELCLAGRYKQPFSCLMLDLDHFKRINDTQGHLAGDKALQQAAGCLQALLRQSDQVFRFGGEEFFIFLSKASHRDALLVAERIRLTLETSSRERGKPLTASVSASTYQANDSADSLLARLDAGLYEAKANGRNCVISADAPPHASAYAKCKSS